VQPLSRAERDANGKGFQTFLARLRYWDTRMFYRPLSLLTIVTFTLCCWAQLPGIGMQGNGPQRSFDSPISEAPFTSSIGGIVHDMSGHPVDNARVEMVDPDTGRSVALVYTQPDGRFLIGGLRNHAYELVATAGTVETRSRVDAMMDNNLSIRLPMNAPVDGNQAAVSVTQMKVPGKARKLLQKAEQAFKRSRLNDAFGFVQKALTCYPNYAKALALRGILNMQKGDDHAAQPDLEKAVALDYTDDTSVVALASLYNNEGQYDRAQQTLDHGMALNPNSWQVKLEMARSQIGKKDYGAAISSLDRAAALAPPQVSLVSLYRAQALIGLKDYKGAIDQLQAFLNKSPNDVNSAEARNILTKLQKFTASGQQ
jgi:tetratricopeptide (TPR) repeat protein